MMDQIFWMHACFNVVSHLVKNILGLGFCLCDVFSCKQLKLTQGPQPYHHRRRRMKSRYNSQSSA